MARRKTTQNKWSQFSTARADKDGIFQFICTTGVFVAGVGASHKMDKDMSELAHNAICRAVKFAYEDWDGHQESSVIGMITLLVDGMRYMITWRS